jgi:hypothetical protein
MDGLTGRWLVRDPIREAGSINLYGYVGANPVRYFDAKGLQAAELMENDAWQTDDFNSLFKNVITGVSVLLFALPKWISIRGPLMFLGFDAAGGAIYTDLNPGCNRSRSDTARWLDVISKLFGVVGSVFPEAGGVFLAGQGGIAALANIDAPPDSFFGQWRCRLVFCADWLRLPPYSDSDSPPAAFFSRMAKHVSVREYVELSSPEEERLQKPVRKQRLRRQVRRIW